MNDSKKSSICLSLALILLSVAGPVLGARLMAEDQLANTTAGSAAAAQDGMVHLQFDHPLNHGGYVSGDGSLSVQQAITNYSAAQLYLSDSAQSNLRALVNINAVNSPVQVLLNLNVNINSSVGQLRQFNLFTPAAP